MSNSLALLCRSWTQYVVMISETGSICFVIQASQQWSHRFHRLKASKILSFVPWMVKGAVWTSPQVLFPASDAMSKPITIALYWCSQWRCQQLYCCRCWIALRYELRWSRTTEQHYHRVYIYGHRLEPQHTQIVMMSHSHCQCSGSTCWQQVISKSIGLVQYSLLATCKYNGKILTRH